MAQVSKINNPNEDEIIEQDNLKEPKPLRFFSKFIPTEGEDFHIIIYRLDPRNKQTYLDEYNNMMPSMSEIRELYGVGSYKIFAYNAAREMIDSCNINVGAGAGTQTEIKNPAGVSKKEILEEMKQYKEILGDSGHNDNSGISDVLIKLMDMQQKNTESTMRIVSEMKESLLKNQIESERKFFELLKSQEGKKGTVAEIMEVVEFVENIRGTNENSLLEKILPYAQPLLSGVMGTKLLPELTGKKEKKEPAIDYETILKSIPEDFKKLVTKENKSEFSNKVYEGNKNLVTKEQCDILIDMILKERGIM